MVYRINTHYLELRFVNRYTKQDGGESGVKNADGYAKGSVSSTLSPLMISSIVCDV